MSDPESIYPRIETGYAFTQDMNKALVEKFNNQTFTQGSAILKINFYNRKDLIIHHISAKGRVNKMEINRIRNRYIVDVLTVFEIQENFKIGSKVVQIFEGVIHCELFKVSAFKKVIDKLFELRHKYKDENEDVMQLLNKLIMNSLYGEQIRKDIEESYQCKSEVWMMTEYDGRVLDYQKNNYDNFIEKMKDDEGVQDEVRKVHTMPLQTGAFVLSNSGRFMNKFIRSIDGFYTNDV